MPLTARHTANPTRRRRLRSLVLVYALAAATPMIALCFGLVWWILKERQADFDEQARDTLRDMQLRLESFYGARRRVLNVLGGSLTGSGRGDLDAFQARLNEARLPLQMDLQLRDADGRLQLSTVSDGQSLPADHLPRETLAAARARRYSVSKAYADGSAGRTLVSATIAIVRGGKVLGFLSTVYRDGDQLVLDHEVVPDTWVVAIADLEGTITAHSRDAAGRLGTRLPEAIMRAALTRGTERARGVTGEFGYALVGIDDNLGRVIAVIVPHSTINARVTRYWWILLLITGAALLATAWLARILAQRVTDPIGKLAEEAETLPLASRSTEPRQEIEEIASLRSAFLGAWERLQSQSRELEATASRLKGALVAGDLGIWESDPESIRIRWDENYCALLGRGTPNTWMPTQVFFDALVPEDRDRVEAMLAARRRGVEAAELRFRILRGGEVRWMQTRYRAIETGDGGSRIVGITRDITELLRGEEAIAERQALLEREVSARSTELQRSLEQQAALRSSLLQSQKLEAIGRLTSGVAHDFGNTLTVILGSLVYLERRNRDPEQLERIRRAVSWTERATRLKDRLLTFARERPHEPVALDLNREIADLLDLAKATVGARIELVIEPGANLWPLRLNRSGLEYAILNLVINARDAMPSGGRITLATSNVAVPGGDTDQPAGADGFVRLTVSDNGTGMPPEVAAKALEPFFSTKSDSGGAGLGLSIVDGFVKESGGALQIRSVPGQGTVVTLDLPRASGTHAAGEPACRPAPHRSGRAASAQAGPSRPSPRILVVDDEDDVRAVLIEQIEELGHAAFGVADGQAAIELLAQDQALVSAVVSDVEMPGPVDGHALARWVREHRPQIRVLLVSAHPPRATADGDTVARLHKPVSTADLRAALDALRGGS